MGCSCFFVDENPRLCRGFSEKAFGLSRKCRERKIAYGQMYI